LGKIPQPTAIPHMTFQWCYKSDITNEKMKKKKKAIILQVFNKGRLN